MLAQTKPRVNVWKQIGAPEPKVAAAKLMKQNDNFGYKVCDDAPRAVACKTCSCLVV